MNSKTRIEVFDLDHTLIQQSASFGFCQFLCAEGIFSKRALLEAVITRWRSRDESYSLKAGHRLIFEKVLKGFSLEKIESAVDPFLDQFLWKSIYPPAFTALRRYQHCGAFVSLMSSSPAFLVKKIAERFHFDHWLATEYETDAQGNLFSIKEFLDGEAKAKHLNKMIQEKEWSLNLTRAYSDSYEDLPLLLSVQEPIAVNPDPRLRIWALDHQWEIL